MCVCVCGGGGGGGGGYSKDTYSESKICSPLNIAVISSKLDTVSTKSDFKFRFYTIDNPIDRIGSNSCKKDFEGPIGTYSSDFTIFGQGR